jgi:hypothetical protein
VAVLLEAAWPVEGLLVEAWLVAVLLEAAWPVEGLLVEVWLEADWRAEEWPAGVSRAAASLGAVWLEADWPAEEWPVEVSRAAASLEAVWRVAVLPAVRWPAARPASLATDCDRRPSIKDRREQGGREERRRFRLLPSSFSLCSLLRAIDKGRRSAI